MASKWHRSATHSFSCWRVGAPGRTGDLRAECALYSRMVPARPQVGESTGLGVLGAGSWSGCILCGSGEAFFSLGLHVPFVKCTELCQMLAS